MSSYTGLHVPKLNDSDVGPNLLPVQRFLYGVLKDIHVYGYLIVVMTRFRDVREISNCLIYIIAYLLNIFGRKLSKRL